MFAAFSDASKAFDKVNHYILFKKLTECNVPEIFVKLLANWYSSQLLCVRWGTTYSRFFTVSNGVRQSSILRELTKSRTQIVRGQSADCFESAEKRP